MLKSWKLLIDRTFQKRDSYQNNNDLANFIKTNASLCVHIHTLFCGCRAQEEISHLIVQDFKDHSPNCIEFKLSGDFKTHKLGANFNFLDRESSFIFLQKYCDPFRIFMYYRRPSEIDRFFYIINRLLVLEMEFCCRNPNPLGLSLLHKRWKWKSPV